MSEGTGIVLAAIAFGAILVGLAILGDELSEPVAPRDPDCLIRCGTLEHGAERCMELCPGVER